MKAGRWLGQAALAALLVWFVGRAVAGQWEALRAAEWRVSPVPGWVALSVVLTLVTFGLQVQSWRAVLAGYGQPLSTAPATRIWFLANLGRYLPGKVWSVAGMIVLAGRAGVAAWAATAAAVVLQALGLGAALALVVATLPAAEAGLRGALAAAAVAATLLLAAWPPAIRLLQRTVPRLADLRPLPAGYLLAAAALSFAAWIAYGLAFWALGRGLGLGALPVGLAIGAFALAYTVGLLALFAPGGAVVREAVLLALLGPALGAGAALTLALASRLVLTVAELAVAVPFLISQPRSTPGATGP